MTLAGLLTALVLMIAGYKPKRWGHCIYFEIGKHWGGFNLGMVFLRDTTSVQKSINDHELGHGIQNCYFGFLTPFLVTFPSIIRYWYQTILEKKGRQDKLKPYDAIWFEGQATRAGSEFMKWHMVKYKDKSK